MVRNSCSKRAKRYHTPLPSWTFLVARSRGEHGDALLFFWSLEELNQQFGKEMRSHSSGPSLLADRICHFKPCQVTSSHFAATLSYLKPPFGKHAQTPYLRVGLRKGPPKVQRKGCVRLFCCPQVVPWIVTWKGPKGIPAKGMGKTP